MKNKKIVKLFIILVIVICLILLIMFVVSNKKVNKNEALNERQTIELFKRVRKTLLNSQGLEGNKFNDEVMVKFAFDYMVAADRYNINYDLDNNVAVVSIKEVLNVVRYVFDKEINLANVKYRIDNNYIYIDLQEYSTDSKIYKFREQISNSDSTYVIYIDCLEANGEMHSELSKDNVTKYDESNIIMTFAFKYKKVDGRNVLLAYECDTKW